MTDVLYAEELAGKDNLDRTPQPGPAGIHHEIIVARLTALFDQVATETANVGRLANLMAIAVLELRRRGQATDAVRLAQWQQDGLNRSIVAAYQRLQRAETFDPEWLRIATKFCISMVRFWASPDARRAARGDALEDINDVMLAFQLELLSTAIYVDLKQRDASRRARTGQIVDGMLKTSSVSGRV